MRILKGLLALALLVSVAACAKHTPYTGPEVTRIVVYKEARRMHFLHHDQVLTSYDIGLGFTPVGDKKISGDGKTPEGDYFIDRHNPNSEFFLSVGISYPDNEDRAEARSLGKSPGGDIFIHGRPWKYRKGGRDWTAGCIAVTNKEMREIYGMLRKGTRISIYP
jgi:murein L,D-transpeptidase YafK